MSIAREIKIQRLQDKNRMVGETFNPSGITSKQIGDRETVFITEWQNKTLEERKSYWKGVKEVLNFRKENNIHISWEWEWGAFSRHFIFNSQVI